MPIEQLWFIAPWWFVLVLIAMFFFFFFFFFIGIKFPKKALGDLTAGLEDGESSGDTVGAE